MRAALLCMPLVLSAGCTTVPNHGSQATILAVDDQQRAMVAASDVAGLESLAHPNLRINAPGGRVLTREQFLANMRSGEIAAEGFERIAEDVSISGNIAVVMGRETFTPAATSELGRTFGARPLHRRYTNLYIWQQGRWLWLTRHANVLPTSDAQQLAANTAPAHPPHVGVPGRCEDKAENGGGAEGCFWHASVPIGRVGPQLYWHIDRFPDVASAEAAKTTRGTVTTALGGQVFLQTVTDDPRLRPLGGERLSTVGPLIAPSATELTARFMEATTSKASATFPHIHSGPEGFFLLEGSICVETPAGVHRAGAGGSLALPGGVPMQLSHAGQTVRRSLVLVVHPSTTPWIDRQPEWTPTGACRA